MNSQADSILTDEQIISIIKESELDSGDARFGIARRTEAMALKEVRLMIEHQAKCQHPFGFGPDADGIVTCLECGLENRR